MEIFTIDALVGLLTLTALELVLGIDNIVLLAILVERLPKEQQAKARRLGLSLALIFRLLLLTTVTWLTKLTEDLFTVMNQGVSVRDLILILGGLFLMAKATTEIVHVVEARDQNAKAVKTGRSLFFQVILNIILFDLIFSLDSVLTAVGLTEHLWVMMTSVILAVLVMMIFAAPIGNFVQRNPGIKTLALAFLVMIGLLLVAEGFDAHFNRGYVYFAMCFSLGIELLNHRRVQKSKK